MLGMQVWWNRQTQRSQKPSEKSVRVQVPPPAPRRLKLWQGRSRLVVQHASRTTTATVPPTTKKNICGLWKQGSASFGEVRSKNGMMKGIATMALRYLVIGWVSLTDTKVWRFESGSPYRTYQNLMIHRNNNTNGGKIFRPKSLMYHKP